MKGMIFCAGVGSRLGEITENKPKALVDVGGVPMLERVIIKMKGAGITGIAVNTHHHASQIVDFLASRDNFGIEIHISDETDRLLDTGGGLLKASKWFVADEPLLLHNADILTDFSLSDMLEAHLENDADATLLVDRRSSSRCLYLDGHRRMQGWGNLKTGENRFPEKRINAQAAQLTPLSFGGVHIIKPTSIFPALRQYAGNTDEIKPFSITDFYISACGYLNIKGYTPSEPYSWYDIGRPDTLQAARESLL